MQALHYPFIDLAVHAPVRDRFAKGDAVAVLSADLGEVLWVNGAAAQLFGFDNIYDALDEGLTGQIATRRQIESALSGLRRTGKPQAFMMRLSSGFSRSMTPASLEDITLPDGARALLLVNGQAGQILGPGARARQIISGFEGTGTHVAVLDRDGRILAASRTFNEIGLARSEIGQMIADVSQEQDRLVKRMTEARNGPMPTAIGRLADDPALHLLFAVEPAFVEEPDDETKAPATPDHLGDAAQADAAEFETPIAAVTGPEFDTDASQEPETVSASEDADPELEAPHHVASNDETADDDAAPSGIGDDAPNVSDDNDVSGDKDEPEAAGETPASSEPVYEKPAHRPGLFDTSRIRDELNARLARARAEQEREDQVPPPFADARNLDLGAHPEPDVAGDDAHQEADPGSDPGKGAHADPNELHAVQIDGEEPGETEMSAQHEHENRTGPAQDSDPDQPSDVAERDQPEATGDGGTDNLSVSDGIIAAQAPEFRFDPDGKPARFVWKINRDGKFSDVSPEFAAAVGPHSADIIGRSFPDLARVFNLDPDHVISELLNRRDTWSGKTVYWPIQGTSLATPVDLAALPTYTRDRQFDGFRGFGIVRIAETREDPEALGLALVPGARPRAIEPIEAEAYHANLEAGESEHADASDHPGETIPDAEDEADLEIRALEQDIEDLARMDGVEDETWQEPGGAEDEGATSPYEAETGAEDPFRGERPAIHLVETPMRRDSDKIIDLEARRPRSRDGLSPGEQAAFREIGERLNETSANADDANAESASQDQQQDRPAFGRRQPQEGDDQPENGDIEINFDSGQPDHATAELTSNTDQEAVGTAADDNASGDAARPAQEPPQGPAQQVEWIDPPVAEPMPSAFALPPRQEMQAGMDAGLVDAIPAALLVHSGDDLIHANAEFLELTGYGSLGELARRGGLDHLLDRSEGGDMGDDGGMIIRRGDGATRMVTARLRSINWGDSQALLLALSSKEAAASIMGASVITPAEAEALAEADAPETGASEASVREVGSGDQSAALKIEAQELRSILETATDGVVILDHDGAIRSMNGSACALFNYDEGETQGQPFAMLFAHESQRAVMDYVSGLAEHGVSSVLNDGREVIGREASGGFLPLFMTIGRLSGSNGYCAVLRDITQWKRTEEELRTAKRAAETANSHKSDFLARVSHEIRTPLNAIIGFSEMMVEERFGPIGSPRYLEYAHDIGNSGKHVLDIVNDLLDISKIEAGQEQMEFVAVSLNDHLAESVSLLQPMANSQRVIIRTSLSASVPEVVADRRSIKQIALNLLSNAIRFTPSGGQIVVSTSYEPSGNVVIRIRDTGIGMNRKELEQAMKPFGQVGPGPRSRGDGTGLGLPLTKAMVEANRAQFDIVSTPSEGTLVSVAFPPQRVLAD